ncbi:cation-translocating P-type ATPase (plasmid) [Acidovorax sp. DW039]|uniref:cation-translocating P-type ATPase n=1 Tax=Acidovorax sp. DW039 TaxID=3095606 RepID=UPI003089228C|nr:cation-translocating P-type ATPase [Acidovorax sp. DW039]
MKAPTQRPLRDPSRLSAAEVLQALASDADKGLSAQDASDRLRQDGPNQLRATSPQPAWRLLLSQFNDPLIYLLLGAIVVALAAWRIDGATGWPVDALVVALVVLLNGVLGFVQQARARQAVAALASMTAVSANVLRDGRLQRVRSEDLVCGDLLVLGEGDAVGADARLTWAAALRTQESSLTGESQAILKDPAALQADAPLGDRLCMVFKGTTVAQGTGRAVVTATAMDTEIGHIAHLLDTTQEKPTPLQTEIAHIGRALGIGVLAIAAVVVLTIVLMTPPTDLASWIEVLLLGVSLAVATVPEGLPAILSVVLALGVQRMARRKAIVRNLSSVETLGCASVICSDKTGTLTRAEMSIERIVTASGSTQVTGAGYAPTGQVQWQGAVLTAGTLYDEQAMVLQGGSQAGNASLLQTQDGAWQIQGDPTDAAFLVAERKLVPGTTVSEQPAQRVTEIPFTSERKMMSVIVRDAPPGTGMRLLCKGAPDVLLAHCTHQRVGTGLQALNAAARMKILADVDGLSDAALRPMGVAYRPLAPQEDAQSGDALEVGLVYVGTVGMIDPPREEAMLAILEAHRAGIRVVMITGDHPRTAARIATDLGIAKTGERVLTGLDLDALDAKALAAAVRLTNVYARVSPRHKLSVVAALQASGEIVAMTGDGVNDAPALKAADIGIAMGLTGTDVTKQAARMVLADDNFATIVQAVREGRTIFENIRKFLRYLLSSNMGEVLTVFLGVVGAGVIGLVDPGSAMVLPLLATQILWLNLVTDSWPAMAMGLDPANSNVMASKPRPRSERVIAGRMWIDICGTGLVVAMLVLLTMDLYLPGGLIAGSLDITTSRTAGFTVLVIAHLFNCFNARSATASAFEGLFTNVWLWGAVSLSAALQVAVVHVGILNVAFGTTPLSADQWLTCIAMASGVLWYSELRKLLGRLHRRWFPKQHEGEGARR